MKTKNFFLSFCITSLTAFCLGLGVYLLALNDIKAISEEAEGYWDPQLHFLGIALRDNDKFSLGIKFLANNSDPDTSYPNNSGSFIIIWNIFPFRMINVESVTN